MSSIVSFLLEIPFLFFIETKNYKDVGFCKFIFIQMLNLMIWNNFDCMVYSINGVSSVYWIKVPRRNLRQIKWIIVSMSMMVSSWFSLKQRVIVWTNFYQSDITNALHLLELLKFILFHGNETVLELDDFIMCIIEFTFERTLSCAIFYVDISFEVAKSSEAHIRSCYCQIEVNLFLGLGKGMEAAESIGGLRLLPIWFQLFQKVMWCLIIVAKLIFLLNKC